MQRLSGWAFAALYLVSASTEHAAAQESDPLLDISPGASSAIAESREARGVLRARNQAVLSSELAGRILEMPFADGQDFKKDAVLVRFDCSAYQAQLNAAQAAARAAREELSHNKQLAALNSVGRFQVALAEARQAQAQAEAQVYQVQVRRCAVGAPFDGRVVQRKVQPHESVASGTPLLEIVDNRTLEV
ncbi:HlyD family efflux transporter periplasmic adaptor subunit, partial [Pseudomonas sp. CrR25]|nr:HlyD family efflux transporter periplasmic adaptor subunit [Pseudomonas sp. CrR25]